MPHDGPLESLLGSAARPRAVPLRAAVGPRRSARPAGAGPVVSA
ncbi:hypothetical protein ANDO1_0549 [plant metagenome]|uniref:Uncharacterized protein n=1 Tax=plant metagenome TaxID=1297885 RepID=A0A484Q2W0_9ZZZZ